jgi:predicted metal-dependent phosphotriesterase family hydrolase
MNDLGGGSQVQTDQIVQTVLGPIELDELGITLMHEHLYHDLWTLPGRYDEPYQVSAPKIMNDEVAHFGAVGGSCIVDLTVRGMGRDIERTVDVSRQTGVHVVAGTGYYREPYYPPDALIDRRSVGSIAEEFVRDLVEGIDGTDVRAGIIGEIGIDKSWISAQEERVCRAAGRAQAQSGFSITTHSIFTEVGLEQLDLFESEGADPSRVIIGHSDYLLDPEYLDKVVRRDATVQFDCFGHLDALTKGVEGMVLDLLCELIHKGFGSQVLISHDVCLARNLRAFGGHGFSYVPTKVVALLKERGLADTEISTLLVDNPRRHLGVPRRGS